MKLPTAFIQDIGVGGAWGVGRGAGGGRGCQAAVSNGFLSEHCHRAFNQIHDTLSGVRFECCSSTIMLHLSANAPVSYDYDCAVTFYKHRKRFPRSFLRGLMIKLSFDVLIVQHSFPAEP